MQLRWSSHHVAGRGGGGVGVGKVGVEGRWEGLVCLEVAKTAKLVVRGRSLVHPQNQDYSRPAHYYGIVLRGTKKGILLGEEESTLVTGGDRFPAWLVMESKIAETE
jgi:hypothetical protein